MGAGRAGERFSLGSFSCPAFPGPGPECSQPWGPCDFQGTEHWTRSPETGDGGRGVASIVGLIPHLPALTFWFSQPLARSVMWEKVHTRFPSFILSPSG